MKHQPKTGAQSSITLTNGYRATLEEDKHQPGSFTLSVNGTPQSHVCITDPRYLAFDYVRRIGHGIDLVAPEGDPITAVHLGAGALTLARYIEASRPGSRQQVIESESDLIAFVRRELPLPKKAQIRVRHGDARAVLGTLPSGLRGSVDFLISDIFSGDRTPAHVTSIEFYALTKTLLNSQGILAVNVADGSGLSFAKNQARTLGEVFSHLALVADPQVLKSRRFGNVVLFASLSPLPFDRLPRLVASDPVAAKVVMGEEYLTFVRHAAVVTDETAIASLSPSKNVFHLKS